MSAKYCKFLCVGENWNTIFDFYDWRMYPQAHASLFNLACKVMKEDTRVYFIS